MCTDFRLRGNGTPSSCDVLPFEINNENDFLLIGFICSINDIFPHKLSVLKGRLAIYGSQI